MFKGLTYFEFLEDDLKEIREEKEKLNKMLVEAYSPPEKVYCSLKEQIDNILNDEEQLQQILSVILQQIQSSTFLPRQIRRDFLDSLTIKHLPQWLPHVLETEYAKYRPQLDRYALQLANLHELKEKRKLMRDQRQSLETLYRRTLVISAFQKGQHFTDIDIMQDVNHLMNRVKHNRMAFQHFCSQVAGKIRDFVEKIVEKSKIFGKEKTAVADIFKKSQIPMTFESYFPVGQLPQQSFKKAFIPSPARSQLNSPRLYRQQTQKEAYNEYYNRAEKIRIENQPTFISNGSLYGQTMMKTCGNHQQVIHRHTCEKEKDWLRSVKSQQKMHQSPSDRFSYRRFVPSYF